MLEVLVAFSILALSLGVIMQIFSESAANADLISHRAQAAELARSLVAQVAAELPGIEGEYRASAQGSPFNWELSARPDASVVPPSVVEASTLELWSITARVSWPGPPERAVEITTLRARRKPTP